MAVVVGVEEVEEGLGSINSTKTAILVNEVSKLLEVGLIVCKSSADLSIKQGWQLTG